MKTNITKKVKQIIEDEFLIDYDGINDKTNFRNDLGLDSLDKIVLILGCEREFNISINDEDSDKINTFGELIEYLSKRLAQ